MKTLFRIFALCCICLSLFTFIACTEAEGGEEQEKKEITIAYYLSPQDEDQHIVKVEDAVTFRIEIPTRAHSKFIGLYDAPIGGTQVVNDYGVLNFEPEKSMILYAQWESNFYKINFDAKDGTLGTVADCIQQEYDTNLSTLPTPTREGYNFVGWTYNGVVYTDSHGVVLDDKKLFNEENYPIYNGEITLTASWKIKSVNVIFRFNDLNYKDVVKPVDWGSKITPQDFPTLDTGKKEVMGWTYILGSKDLIVSEITDITQELVLYASWQDYVVINLWENDKTVRNEKVYANTQGYVPEPPTRWGYKFDGWYSTKSYSGNPIEQFYYNLTTDTYYAKWKEVVTNASLFDDISFSVSMIFDMRNEAGASVDKTIVVPAGVEKIYLIGNYGSDKSHIFTNLSFLFEGEGGYVEIVLQDFAFSSVQGTPAFYGAGVDLEIIVFGSENLIMGANGYDGSSGTDGSNSSKNPTSGSSGTSGGDGTMAIKCRSLIIRADAAIVKVVGGNGGSGGNGGKGGNISSTNYTGVPSCGNGGNGGVGGNGAAAIDVASISVFGTNLTVAAGSGGNGGKGGNGGNGTFDLIHWCNGGNGGNGGDGGDYRAAIVSQNPYDDRLITVESGSAGSGGGAGSRGKGNGNNFWSATSDRYGKNGSGGSDGELID